jgi:hypothetical protein
MIWLAGSSNALLAQAPADPIYFLHDQTLYKWTDAGLEPFGGQFPKAFSYSVSPIGDKLVYQSDSDLAVKTQAAECPCNGKEWPSNLWIVDLSSGYQTLIASQPDNAQTVADEVLRSHPLWSPDGNMIAWAESHQDDSVLVVFNLITQETKVVAHQLPVPKNGTSVLSSLYAWTPLGIMVEKIDYGPPYIHNGFTFYDAFGNIVLDTPPLPEGSDPKAAFLITNADSVNLLIQSKLEWAVVNFTRSKGKTPKNGILLRYAQGGEQVSPRIAPAVMDEAGDLQWAVSSPDGKSLTTLTSSTPPIFSLKGRAILYAQADAKMKLWRADSDGGAVTITLPWSPDGIITGKDAYTLQPGIATQFITSTRCESSNLPFRLSVGNGQVLNNATANIRFDPRRDAKLLGQIPAGESFKVLDWPRCSGGIAWWYVDNVSNHTVAGLPGWVAEGTGNTYWLEPHSGESG